MTRSFATALACAAGVISASPAGAQDAVALSGGGSRGIAHAGALAGIRQRGYDPDLIVGTSMGSVIGALYAAGLPTDSLIRFARTEDWAALFTPLPLVLGARREPRQPVIDMRLGGGDPRTATGLISDTRINRRLVRALFDAGARAGGDFDRLP
ncbi:MAG: patatin-like phospholipase family protein, partial [Longimicrobiales bacterium]